MLGMRRFSFEHIRGVYVETLLIAIVLVAAVGLRLWPLLVGDPVRHPDEYNFVFFPLNFFSGDFNPHFFAYPTLHFYLVGLVYSLHFLLSNFSIDQWVAYHYFWHPDDLLQVARLLTVAFSIGAILWVYAIGRHIAGAFAGIASSSFLAFNIIHIRHSGLAAVDVPLAFWVAGATWAMLRLVKNEKWYDYALAGTLVGLAGSCKYPALVLVLTIPVAHLVAARRFFDHRLLLACTMVLVSFALTAPYVIVDISLTSKYLLNLASLVEAGTGSSDYPPALYYLWISARYGVGWGGFLALVLCIIFLLYKPQREVWVLLAALTCYYGIISWGEYTIVRYAVPLLGLQSVILGLGLGRLNGLWRYSFWVLLLIEPVYGSISLVHLQSQQDTRNQAKLWIEEHVPSGARIGNFGGWTAEVPISTVDELWWRLRHFEDVFGRERVDESLDFLERTQPSSPIYRTIVPMGSDRALFAGNWDLVEENEASYILIHKHELHYSYIDADFARLLPERANRVQNWHHEASSSSSPVYDPADAYYVPIGGWESLRSLGPEVELWDLGIDRVEQEWTVRQLLALAYAVEARAQMRKQSSGVSSTLQRALDMADPTSDVLFTIVEWYEQQGKYAEAQRYCQEVIKIEPDSRLAHSMLGSLHMQVGEYDKALEVLQHALDLGTKSPNVYNNMGIAHIQQVMVDKGIGYLQQAVKSSPNFKDAWYNLAVAQQMNGQLAEAEMAYLRLIELDENHQSARTQLAAIYIQRANELLLTNTTSDIVKKAIGLYGRAVELDAENTDSYANQGRAYYLAGELAKAQRAFERVLAVGPSAVAQYNLGLVKIASGQEKEAEQTYAAAVAQYGAVEGERIGAVDDLRALLSTEHEAAAQRILQRYWPNLGDM